MTLPETTLEEEVCRRSAAINAVTAPHCASNNMDFTSTALGVEECHLAGFQVCVEYLDLTVVGVGYCWRGLEIDGGVARLISHS